MSAAPSSAASGPASSGRRVLVTGAAGFIGSNLTARLLRDGASVIGLDNLSTGRLANIEPLLGHPGLRFVKADVREPVAFDVDEIYHLACPAAPRAYLRDPVGTIATILVGTVQVLELARRTRARVLLTSTSEIYGSADEHPQNERYAGRVDPTSPRACYAESKRCAETTALAYARQLDVDVGIVRIFNTYGPHMAPDDGRVTPTLIVQALAGAPMTLTGSGRQTRSFCYVDDLVEALLLVQATDDRGPMNLGNPEEITMLELAEVIRGLVGSRSAITFVAGEPDDPPRRQPDITRAIERLGWRPTTSLAEGLRRTVEFLRV